jgi:hypothetical protein
MDRLSKQTPRLSMTNKLSKLSQSIVLNSSEIKASRLHSQISTLVDGPSRRGRLENSVSFNRKRLDLLNDEHEFEQALRKVHLSEARAKTSMSR